MANDSSDPRIMDAETVSRTSNIPSGYDCSTDEHDDGIESGGECPVCAAQYSAADDYLRDDIYRASLNEALIWRVGHSDLHSDV